nr:MAG TPA: hypothetical protein [Caudoviricetes sp.]
MSSSTQVTFKTVKALRKRSQHTHLQLIRLVESSTIEVAVSIE